MQHKVGELVYHPNISEDGGSLGEIVEIRNRFSEEEEHWYGEELEYFVLWHRAGNLDYPVAYDEDDVVLLKNWLQERL